MQIEEIRMLREKLKRSGFATYEYDDGPIHSYPYDTPWLDDESFCRIYNNIRDNTLVDRTRCYALYILAQQVQDIDGDVIEIGVWRGGTSGIFTTLLPAKTVYLADTFKGVVNSSEWEHYKDRAHDDTSIEIVENLLQERLGVKNFRILPGIFPRETSVAIANRKFALVHIDVDVYLSAKEAFLFLWPHVSSGGVVVFDDYGFMTACSGIRKFVDEIKHDSDKLFIHNMNGHAYIIKR